MHVFTAWTTWRTSTRTLAAPACTATRSSFAAICNPDGDTPRSITWHYPRRSPPRGHGAARGTACWSWRHTPFRAALHDGRPDRANRERACRRDGAILPCSPRCRRPASTKRLTSRPDRVRSPTACMPRRAAAATWRQPRKRRVRRVFPATSRTPGDLALFWAPTAGAPCCAPRPTGADLGSRYDALLAANLHPHIPVNRQILLTRCRAWVVFQGYSQEIGPTAWKRFGFDSDPRAAGAFRVPTGQGQNVRSDPGRTCRRGANAVTRLTFHRHRPATAATPGRRAGRSR